MNLRMFMLVYSLLILNMACSNSSKPDPLLEEAFLIHKQSLTTAKETQKILEGLPANDEYRLKMESRFKHWNENIIEVPGFEHDHSHGHEHHHHHHNTQIELTPEDQLIVQKELLDSIRVIKEELLVFVKQF